MTTEHEITVIDVFRRMKLETDPHFTWAVGRDVRKAWGDRHGCAPPYRLLTKTSGGGSHCFAVYPATFEPVIREIVKRHGPPKESQPALF